MKIVKQIIERNPEIGLIQIELDIRRLGAKLLSIKKTHKNWHVVYQTK